MTSGIIFGKVSKTLDCGIVLIKSEGHEAVAESNTLSVESAMQSWVEAFSAEHPDTILALYADDAVLWGTLSPTRRDDPTAIRDYFEQVFNFVRQLKNSNPFIINDR